MNNVVDHSKGDEKKLIAILYKEGKECAHCAFPRTHLENFIHINSQNYDIIVYSDMQYYDLKPRSEFRKRR